MPQKIYLVDAFSHGPFTGNPAAVCPLEREPDEQWMQSVAMEMNQAETAFYWPREDGYGLRWFTPAVEVDLCGHATLASAHVLFENSPLRESRMFVPDSGGGVGGGAIHFHTKSGELVCTQSENGIAMDFPAEAPSEIEPFDVTAALGVQPVWTGANRMDWFFEFASAEEVLSMRPNFHLVNQLGKRGVIVTTAFSPLPSGGEGSGVRGFSPHVRTTEPRNPDFISRFFAPQSGIEEDPVTGSAHCALGPYWASKLGKSKITGYQASKRGGYVQIGVRGDRVGLSGQARIVVEGTLSA